MDTWLVNTLAFLATFFAVIAANAVLLTLGAKEHRRLDQQLHEHLRQRRRERVHSQQLEQRARAEGIAESTLWRRLATVLDESGLNITVQRVVVTCVVLTLVAGTLAWTMTGNAVLALSAALVAPTLPFLYVFHARRQRLERMLAQLPDAFDLMSRVLRSGQTMSQAMQFVADEFSPPISLEFYHCREQMNLGLPPDAALHDLARRTGLLEMKIFAVAVLVQQQTGGNLSELFDKMSVLVRERYRIRGMINSLTAQGRIQAWILLSLPVAMFALLMTIRPDYEMVLLHYPWLIVTALGLMGLGAIWIHRVVHFDF